MGRMGREGLEFRFGFGGKFILLGRLEGGGEERRGEVGVGRGE